MSRGDEPSEKTLITERWKDGSGVESELLLRRRGSLGEGADSGEVTR